MIEYKLDFYDNLLKRESKPRYANEKEVLFHINDSIHDMVDVGDFIKITVNKDKRDEEDLNHSPHPNLGAAIFTLIKTRGHWMNREQKKESKAYLEKLLER